MGRDRYLAQSLGKDLNSTVKEAKVLMVGAGGIGCELLKNLILSGFKEIHVVDLDTIDLSNLNRQFLFRHEHIKRPKAIVAKETAGRFNPNVKLESHHGNIKDPQFNIDWFRGFQLVFNALDNLEARRHVNKMCLATNIPLIESGTTGFNGQVQVIVKGKSECYDCNVKETPKSFPICTIRSTPSQPIHCIVWAKSYLFAEIFGTSEDDVPELDTTEDGENAKEIETLREEAHALKRIRKTMGSDDFPQAVFQKVFTEDITRLRTMEDMWKTRKPPEVLDFEDLSGKASAIETSISRQDQTSWSLEENYKVFEDSLRRLSQKFQIAQSQLNSGDPPAILTFDKDDEDALDFVAACANLRAHVFGIETKSKFETKQMAGNIIPAIATTNAMVAGLCVLQAFKVLKSRLDTARMVFLTRSTERVLTAEKLRSPNPECPTCGVTQVPLEVDTSRATLNHLVGDFLRLELGYGEEFSVNSEIGTLYDPELDDNLAKKLSDLGIKADSFLTVIDEDEENPRVNLQLMISEKSFPEDSKPIVAPADTKVPRKPKAEVQTNGHVNGDADSHAVPDGVNGKRKRSADNVDELEEQITKRGKVVEEPVKMTNDSPIILDDAATNGAILIDDD
ncbi:MAG: hypothetical protein M4579_004167 [Chaenotheca gracillima]|nr:MAG: hypothetical protein M4579_004167 [Chaenotheca gracillima]